MKLTGKTGSNSLKRRETEKVKREERENEAGREKGEKKTEK